MSLGRSYRRVLGHRRRPAPTVSPAPQPASCFHSEHGGGVGGTERFSGAWLFRFSLGVPAGAPVSANAFQGPSRFLLCWHLRLSRPERSVVHTVHLFPASAEGTASERSRGWCEGRHFLTNGERVKFFRPADEGLFGENGLGQSSGLGVSTI